MKKVLNTNRLSILIVDDELNIRKTLAICLEASGHEIMSVSNAKDALTESGHRVFDLAFVDLRLGTDNGMDLVGDLIEICPWIKIIVITAYAAIETAVEAMRRGAADYLPKPFTPEQVEIAVHRAAKLRVMERRISELNHDLHRHHPEITLTSNHPGMMKTLEIARQVAPSEATVMLRGPSGTGKTALARAIHEWSERSGKPLGIVSCPSLSPELLESELFGHAKGAFTGALRDNPGRVSTCEGGTLFLDEIGDLPLSIQPKLLRRSEERRVGKECRRLCRSRWSPYH
jgi:NtrC-family two-component system response regulator AlgB